MFAYVFCKKTLQIYRKNYWLSYFDLFVKNFFNCVWNRLQAMAGNCKSDTIKLNKKLFYLKKPSMLTDRFCPINHFHQHFLICNEKMCYHGLKIFPNFRLRLKNFLSNRAHHKEGRRDYGRMLLLVLFQTTIKTRKKRLIFILFSAISIKNGKIKCLENKKKFNGFFW